MHTQSSQRALKPHARLTQEQAVAIFKVRGSALLAVNIATCFGISEKTVRDIWTARTWSRETSHLDPTRTVEVKQIGRPKGCRDSKPRQKRVNSTRAVSHGDKPCRSQKEVVHGCCLTLQGPYGLSLSKVSPTDLKVDLLGVLDVSSSTGDSIEYRAPSTSRVDSVDDQLYNWGQEFWTSSQKNDPFCNDWRVADDLSSRRL